MEISRIAIFGGVAILAAAYWSFSGDDAPKRPKLLQVAQAPKASAAPSDFTAADYTAHFDKPKAKLRNVFMPIVKTAGATPLAAAAPDAIVNIPANLAQGDPNWAFTGLAVINGKSLALLENSATHQSGFVKEGEAWKTSRVKRITTESVTFVDGDGAETVVPRFNANQPPKAKEPPDGGFQPLQIGPALQGAIGPNFHIEPLRPGAQRP